MSDFQVGFGFFGRDPGNFSTVGEGAPGRGRAKAAQRQLPDLTDALKLNVQPQAKKSGKPSKELDSPIPESKDEIEKQATGDRFIRGYLDFLKSLETKGEELDPQGLLKQADDLIRVVTGPLGISPDEIEELTITSEYSISEVYQAYAQTDGESARAGVYAAAALSARYTADIRTKDGREYHVEISIDAAAAFGAEFESQGGEQQADPLTLDLNGDGVFSLSDISGGTAFDINADGQLDQTAFVRGPDAFLALDRNDNGRIDDGGELFGDQHGALNGFEELKKFDADRNGLIDRNDPVYERLRALQRLETGEFVQSSLASLEIDYLSLAYQNVNKAAQGNNRITEEGTIFRSSLSYTMADIKLGYRTLSTEA